MKQHRWIVQQALPCIVQRNEDQELRYYVREKKPKENWPFTIVCVDCNEHPHHSFGTPCEGYPQGAMPDEYWEDIV